jgi:hypothetical protein
MRNKCTRCGKNKRLKNAEFEYVVVVVVVVVVFRRDIDNEIERLYFTCRT